MSNAAAPARRRPRVVAIPAAQREWERMAGIPATWDASSGSVLRSYRLAHAWAPTEAAAAFGVSVTTWHRWEKGRAKPGPYFIACMAGAFRCSPEVFAPAADPASSASSTSGSSSS